MISAMVITKDNYLNVNIGGTEACYYINRIEPNLKKFPVPRFFHRDAY